METTKFNREVNPEVDQDRVADLWDTFLKYGYVMFPQQKRIYEQLAEALKGHKVLEIGCGVGTGSAVLSRTCEIVATDKLQANINLARELYPWIDFAVLDANQPFPRINMNGGADYVVAVEVLEHISNPLAALISMLNICKIGVIISTPNGFKKESPPSNPFHVAEYSITEMLILIGEATKYTDTEVNIRCMDWQDFKLVKASTEVSPLVYYIKKHN